MRKYLFALLLLASGLVHADVQLKENHPTEYTVVKGDTLWDISGKFLQQPWRWKEVWHSNPQIQNPDLIYPGDTLFLSYVNGQPRISVKRGASRGTIKLSPRTRVTPVAEAVPAIPLQAISSFLLNNRIINNASEFTKAPHVVGSGMERVVTGAGDRVYIRGKLPDGQKNFSILRQGKVYTDPKTKEVLGIDAENVGRAALVSTDKDISSMDILSTTQEVRLGDRVFVTEDRPITAVFVPKAPERKICGNIIDIPRGVTKIAKLDVVTIDKGSEDGLEDGSVLAVYRVGETVQDRITSDSVKMPDERAGMMMVVKTYKRVSYAMLLNATRDLNVGDKVRNPD